MSEEAMAGAASELTVELEGGPVAVELKHHYGWKRHEVEKAKDINDAAYLAVRGCHDFLTDENHTYDAREREVEWGGERCRYMSVLIYRGPGASPYAGPRWAETDYWFAVEYRKPSNVEGKGRKPA